MAEAELWLRIAAVLGTLFVAIAAWRGASETKKSARGQLLTSLSQEFWSSEFHNASRQLGEWAKRDDFVRQFEEAIDQFEPLLGPNEGRPSGRVRSAPRVDDARRAVKGYYHTVWRLQRSGAFSEDDVRNLLTAEPGTELLLSVVEHLEGVVAASGDYNPEADGALYTFFDQLYDERLKRPLRPE